MRILIVNDDSVSAPGIAVLAKAALAFGEVTVVAPMHQCSAMSQKLTIHGDMELKQVPDFPVPVKDVWALEGTPVDCVKVALNHILPEKPDVVLSGINNGYNTGFDIAYSGTLGAAFEAARNGIRAIALSVTGDAHLDGVAPYLTDILKELMETPLSDGMVWNVNFPAHKPGNPKGILRDRVPAPVSLYRETYIEARRSDGTITVSCQGIPTPLDNLAEGTDARAVKTGYISIGTVNATIE
ncbi:MAG: 5'/3'-nucleotidase SurE [Oscillospiraceae bacterium]|nr:5'/3'-nucleotidase SurE [Oscillospiraceae bacterium]